MKKSLLFFLLSFLLIILYGTETCQAKVIDSTLAKSVARNFYSRAVQKNAQNIKLIHTEKDVIEVPVYYIFTFDKNNGFVIVSGEDETSPILGYSREGNYSADRLSPEFLFFMQNYKEQILGIRRNNLKASAQIAGQWNTLQKDGSTKIINALVSPLLSTTWNQWPGYNDLCPGGSPSGCVATTMAQIMKYWNYPQKGVGSHSYTHASYGVQSANFGNTTYNWSNMPNSTSNSEVAKLMYHCGVSVNMDYSPSSSGAWVIKTDGSICAESAFEDYFNYDTALEGISKSNFSSSVWENKLKTELDNSRPIQFAGWSYNYSEGHSWVCDGYEGSYFHMNWGWGGYADGYFLIDDLTPGSSNFSYRQQAIIGIKPKLLNDNCSTAQLINAGTSCSYTQGNVSGATASGIGKPSCDGYGSPDMKDVWYMFTTPVSGTYKIQVIGSSYFDAVTALYANCNGLEVSGACSDISGSGNSTIEVSLNAGNTYYIRVYDYGNVDPSTTTFDICVTYTSTCTPPVAPVASSPTNISANSFTANWGFVNGVSSYLVDVSTNPSFPTYASFETTNLSLNITGLSCNTSYYYRVRAKNNCISAYSLVKELTTSGCGSNTPVNDNCSGAIQLAVNASCNYMTNQTNAYATAQFPAIYCSGFTASDYNDVWYKFVATATNHTIKVLGNTNFDAVVGVYSSCSSSGLIDCIDENIRAEEETLNMTGLSIGTTYYIRVYNYIPDTDTFSICVVGAPQSNPPGNFALSLSRECSNNYSRIRLTWQESAGATSYELYQNNTYFDTFTSNNPVLVNVADGHTYSYYIIAKNANGSTYNSNSTQTIEASICKPPNSFALSATPQCNGTTSRMKLEWGASLLATSYELYQNNSLINTYSTNEAVLLNVTQGNYYSYYVIAKNAIGSLNNSNGNQVVQGIVCEAPGSFTLSVTPECNNTTSRMKIKWTQASLVTSYNLYQNNVLYDYYTSNPEVTINVNAGSIYSYHVVAINTAGNTSNSNGAQTKAALNCSCIDNPTLADYNNGTVVQIKAPNTIEATNKVNSGAKATYQAGKSISLTAGFKADSGSMFKAQIGGCNN